MLRACLVEEDLATGDGDVEEEVEVGDGAVPPRRLAPRRRRRLPAPAIIAPLHGGRGRARRAWRRWWTRWGGGFALALGGGAS